MFFLLSFNLGMNVLHLAVTKIQKIVRGKISRLTQTKLTSKKGKKAGKKGGKKGKK